MVSKLSSACDGVLQSVVTGKDRVPGVVAMITDRFVSLNRRKGLQFQRTSPTS
jgi:methyl acetate hydrolase